MGDVTASEPRCPRCRAAVRVGAPWCTQCYAGLVPEPRPAPVTTTDAPPSPSSVPVPIPIPPPAASTVPVGVRTAGEASWPCQACGTDNALADAACGCCGAGFLAALRGSDGPLLELPGVGDVGALSRAQRLGLGVALVGVVVLLTVLLGLLTS